MLTPTHSPTGRGTRHLRALVLSTLALSLTIAGARALDSYIIDGDTVKQAGETYRLVGLNTPEIHGQCDKEIALALAAKARLKELWPRARLTPVPCAQGERDKYGRRCARVDIFSPSGLARQWASIAISEGLAEPYTCIHGRCPRRRSWCP